jgi:ribosomal protein S18 acetylase RimI-like enzyme
VIDELESLWRTFTRAQQAAAGSMWEPLDDEESWRRARERHALRLASDSFLLLARRNQELIGYALLGVIREPQSTIWALRRREAVLHYICVGRENQRTGVGRALITAIEQELQAEGVERILLHALAGNHQARRFYRQHGFAEMEVGMIRCIAPGDDDRKL